jgi:hypothetical protein
MHRRDGGLLWCAPLGAPICGRRSQCSPEYVPPYVKAQKNDYCDAEAIAEAATRPSMRFVEIKREAQLDDMQSLHGNGNASCPSEQRSSISFGHC